MLSTLMIFHLEQRRRIAIVTSCLVRIVLLLWPGAVYDNILFTATKTRVPLALQYGRANSDYINANFVRVSWVNRSH